MRATALIGASLLLGLVTSSASAQQAQSQRSAAEAAVPGHSGVFASTSARRLMGDGSFAQALDMSKQHGMPEGHLPPARENVELVGKLEPTRAFGPIVEGQIADGTVHDGFAYLNSWDEPSCKRGGVYVVDIRNPASPREVAFIPALPVSYHGEGAQVFEFDTDFFKGPVLAVNNETCTFQEEVGAGGFDLYDIRDPRNPRILVQDAGDRGPDDGTLTGDAEHANSAHNIRLWEHEGEVYAVSVDNLELHDVDIFKVSDPRNPQPIAEFDLIEEFPQITDELANGNLVFNHDDVIKTIGGVPYMMLSYWDAGYVKLDVSDPANPVYVGDTSFDGEDPLVDGVEPPEGNAHQVEFSEDNQYLLAGDEDFAPYRAGAFSITTGPNAGEFPAQEVGGGTSAASLPDLTLNGPTVYGGYACNGSAPVPPRASAGLPPLATGEEAIVVLQRGPSGDPANPEAQCFPGEKAANGIAAGYDAVLLVNRHLGSADLDEPFCGSGGFTSAIVTLCTTHEAFHRIFNSEPQFGLPVPATGEPALGTLGEKVSGESDFDGWGYAHLYENGSGKLRRVDSFAIPEALDERFAFGFGDLSIHEMATDPTEPISYSSYYAGGFRVFSFGEDGIEEQGKYIDPNGNNFWGVEQYTTPDGERLILGSDRDFGLFIFRYNGPGAAAAPECEDVEVETEVDKPVTVPLTCTDENDNPLTLSIVDEPKKGELGRINQSAGTVRYRPDRRERGRDSFTFQANDGAADSNVATASIRIRGGDTDDVGGEAEVQSGGLTAQSAPAPQAVAPTVAAKVAAGRLSLRNRSVRVGRNGVARVRISCGSAVACVGTVKLTLRGKTVARARVSVAPGGRKTVRLRLNQTGRRLLGSGKTTARVALVR